MNSKTFKKNSKLIIFSFALAIGIVSFIPTVKTQAAIDSTASINSLGWVQLDGKWYYYYEDGSLAKGWKNIDGYWYYFTDDCVMYKGWIQLNGYWYYLSETTGVMAKGWKEVDNYWYYFKDDGVMQKGWIQLSGYWYYLDETTGVMSKGWKEVDNYWYYFKDDGVMYKGWLKLDNKWYYLSETTGVMQKGWKEISGYWYYFDNSGKMASNTSVDGYYVDSNGVSKQYSVIYEAKKHLGKPYVWGATGPNSFDCSGFTSYVYRQALGIEIGRTTKDQISKGIYVDKSNLIIGDLIFFKDTYPGAENPSHVGIYLGDNKFIHASSTNGVIIASLDSYWNSHYYSARRIIN